MAFYQNVAAMRLLFFCNHAATYLFFLAASRRHYGIVLHQGKMNNPAARGDAAIGSLGNGFLPKCRRHAAIVFLQPCCGISILFSRIAAELW